MKTKFFLVIIFLIYFISSCKKDDTCDFVAGEVVIGWESGVEVNQIKNRIEELNLEWKSQYENIGVAVIGVPVGEEKYWVEQLNEEPLISYAHLNSICKVISLATVLQNSLLLVIVR